MWKWSRRTRSSRPDVLEPLDGLDHLVRREAELGAVAGRRLPAPAAAAGEAAAQPDEGRGVAALAVDDAAEGLDLGRLLDDDHDLVPEPHGEAGHLHVGLVLVAVADHEAGALELGHDREQLGLAADLEAEADVGAGLEQRLDHVPLLVDLDRVDRPVAAGEAVLLGGVAEDAREHAQAVPEDAVEPQQERQRQPLALGLGDDVDERGARTLGPLGMDPNVAVVADREIRAAPPGETVQLSAAVNRPLVAAAIAHCHRQNPRARDAEERRPSSRDGTRRPEFTPEKTRSIAWSSR
jgi:hypothetical protein